MTKLAENNPQGTANIADDRVLGTVRINMKKFCAFGDNYKDKTGELIEESENYCIIKPDYWFQVTAWTKKEVLLFETKEERDNWIKEQGYQYDSR